MLAAAGSNLLAARYQMALSLGWHIVVACLGVGFPIVILVTEGLGLRRGDTVHRDLARRWSQAAAVLFAVGAVSGTILSFEMGILWPQLMGGYGAVFGLPFALEGFAFFIEAIFIGIYLYGWNRLSPRRHLLTGVPVVVAGVLSAFFVVCANAWMNDPQGFRLVGGRVLDPDPIAAMFNPATPVQSAHMIIAAIMVTGYLVAAVHALGLLRGRRGPGQRAAFLIPFTLAAVFTPAQIVVGDAAARYVADRQPVKLAAMEAQVSTEIGPAEHVGGVVVDGRLRYAVVIPHGLSLLLTGRTDTRVSGLDAVPVDQRPPVNVVHLAFDLMVGIGTALLVLGAWLGVTWGRHRDLPRSRWFLRAAVLAGPAAVAALEAGWVTTEVGRQPWIVYRVMRTADAVNTAPGLAIGLVVLVGVYTVLTVSTVYVLRRQGPVASA
ncbi:MAG: cytochrome bd ubiquinol oxidase subunit [Chloroflexota bacterium]|nr:cytochrome bd ubiquinol oxidase subunit [Chloroflexota bacterium]